MNGAQARVAEVLPILDDSSTLEGAEGVLQMFLTCYRVLQTSRDPQAAHLLSQAHRLLQERASKIHDEELRRSFLENVACHREIMGERESPPGFESGKQCAIQP